METEIDLIDPHVQQRHCVPGRRLGPHSDPGQPRLDRPLGEGAYLLLESVESLALVVAKTPLLLNPSVEDELVAWLGVGLALTWSLAQWAGRYYVDRLKPDYHALREGAGIHYRRHWLFSHRRLSSSDWALLATLIVLVTWVAFAAGGID